MANAIESSVLYQEIKEVMQQQQQQQVDQNPLESKAAQSRTIVFYIAGLGLHTIKDKYPEERHKGSRSGMHPAGIGKEINGQAA
jgi:hypothetical protein